MAWRGRISWSRQTAEGADHGMHSWWCTGQEPRTKARDRRILATGNAHEQVPAVPKQVRALSSW